jgi:hypothetical protein
MVNLNFGFPDETSKMRGALHAENEPWQIVAKEVVAETLRFS